VCSTPPRATPKLLELANGQAADATGLARTLKAADRAWADRGGLPTAFFTTGSSSATGTDYLDVLQAWANSVADGLLDVERIVFWWLCCMEEGDRRSLVLNHTCIDAWERWERSGPPPDVDAAVATLMDRGLVSTLPTSGGREATYGIHPGIAAVGRMQAGEDFQKSITVNMAMYWIELVKSADEKEGTEGTGWLVVRAGLAAIPYLIRVEQWKLAAQTIQHVLIRDDSPTTIGAVLPALRRIAAATAGTDFESSAVAVLARALETIEPDAAERQMRGVLAAELDRGDYWSASVAVIPLIRSCRRSGRLSEALSLAEEKISYTRRAGLGPWSQLQDEVERLQVLADMNHTEEVLAEVLRLRAHMSTLPEISQEPEAAVPWSVRELLLGTGAAAATGLDRLTDAIELTDAVIASQQARGATDADVAATQANKATALIRQGRPGEAVAILRECREIFENSHDIAALGKVIDDLPSVEDRRGHGAMAISLQKDALRYKYLIGNVDRIAVSHHNLGHALHLHAPTATARPRTISWPTC
jgi:tetratricopeptide (TPR) repeat protein